jgi:hypothetical protein
VVVPSEAVRGVRAYWVLRHLAEPACDRAQSLDGSPVIASFEPGEEWFYDYRTQDFVDGPTLAAPRWHPATQPAPGPQGKVPRDWQSRLNQ